MRGRQLRGRDPELAVLADLVESAAEGAGGVVLVDGPAGIGKSALLASTEHLAAERGLVVAAARADELDQVTPFGPLVAALRASDPPILAGDDGLLAPELADQRLWLVDRLRTALETAAGSRPVLVSLDDLQWADQATLQAAAAIPPQLFSLPIAWLFSRRATPVMPAMRIVVARLVELGARQVEIGPLDGAAVGELARDILGADPDGGLAELMEQASGNPFYLTEMLRALVSSDRIGRDGARATLGEGGPPEQFQVALRSQVQSLSPEAQRLVEAASVLGAEFAVADVAAVMGASGQLPDPIEESTTAGILVDNGATLSFRHDIIRHAVYEQLPSAVRRSLHRGAAGALSRSGAAASRLAVHLARSARPGDSEALQLLREAALVLRATNPSAAADAALQAFELLAAGDARRAQAATAAIDLLGEAGRLDEALEVADAISGDPRLSPFQEASIHLGISRSWVMTSRRPIERPVPPRVLDNPLVPRHVRSMLLALDASAAAHCDLARAERLSEEATRDAETSADGGAVMLALAVRAGVLFAKGELAEALASAERVLQTMSPGPSSYPHWFMGFCLCPLDRLDEALRFFAHATRDAEQMGSPFSASLADASRAAALLAAGRLDDAAAAAENAVDTAALLGLGQPLGEALRVLTEVNVRRGDLSAATASVGRLRPLLESRKSTATAAWAPALLVDSQGDPARALAELAEGLELLARSNYRLGVSDPPQLAQLAGLALRAGDRGAAATAAAAAESLAAMNPNVPSLAGVAAHARGILEGDPARLREAVALLEQGQRPLAVAAAEEDLAAQLGPDGSTETIALLEAALDRYEQAGARRDGDRVRSALRSRGVRRPAANAGPARSGLTSLTAAELAVSRAIGEGLTSRQTADQLFISVHTVNTHLRHAFFKLGISSRVELGRMLIDDRGHELL